MGVVVLSNTLQVVNNPEDVIREMLRVGRQGIVSIPNFAHWHARWQRGVQGIAPVTRDLPYAWYNSPNLHFLSIRDFREFCRRIGARVLRSIPIIGGVPREGAWWPNLRAREGVFVLEKV
ncbi:MAG: hypothetical protein IIC27_03930 [Chloroflexi bacterium]|nr:hypothetical protein [Chloroflexota bacterium]